ncbi:MAG TPA: DUF177 domain-containing protein [Acetobacteraceae bacterium]
MKSELSRVIRLDRIGPDGLDSVVEATPDECAALAERMMLPGILALSCRFRLTCEGPLVFGEGHLRARVVQTCVISLDEFETAVEERFRIRFVPAGQEDDDSDPESDDEIPYEGNVVDIGEAAAEQLGLVLDPYPRKPGAELPESDAEVPPHPFAGLGALRRTN